MSRHTWPKYLVTDQGSHFTNTVLQELTATTNVQHHLVTAYCPWANGTVERVNREIITLLQRLLIENRLHTTAWPSLVPIVQSVLNHTPVESLDNLAPVTVFSGQPSSTPLSSIFNIEDGTMRSILPPSDVIRRHYETAALSLQKIHKAVEDIAEQRRARDRQRPRYTVPVNFARGDFVLHSRVDTRIPHSGKLLVQWRGPYRITDIRSPLIYEITHLVSGQTKEVHASRLKLYHDSSLNLTEELLDHAARQGDLYEAERLAKAQYDRRTRTWEALVLWKGFEESEATWEPIEMLVKDVPDLVRRDLPFLVSKGHLSNIAKALKFHFPSSSRSQSFGK